MPEVVTDTLNVLDGKKTNIIAALILLAGGAYYFEILTVDELVKIYVVLLGPLIYALRDALKKAVPQFAELEAVTAEIAPLDPEKIAVVTAAVIDRMKAKDKVEGKATAPKAK